LNNLVFARYICNQTLCLASCFVGSKDVTSSLISLAFHVHGGAFSLRRRVFLVELEKERILSM
jgi:hypothetical protein